MLKYHDMIYNENQQWINTIYKKNKENEECFFFPFFFFFFSLFKSLRLIIISNNVI